MIITETTSTPVVSNIAAAPSRFKIKASAKAFKILSGFYSEPILAIPRELGANAWDSHVKAGNTNQMFEVHAPNALEPWFSVRDFGTGLSPQSIDTIYTTYFESTKTADNDSDGCMGLGSKTPFNYTDNFNVTSWYNGKKHVYNCFIDEHGAPNIMHIATEDTKEANGLEVKFGVKISDISMWTDKILRAYEPFRYRPIIKGANITYPERKYVFSGKNWGMRERDTHQSNVSFAFMGNYCYPISSNVLQYALNGNGIANMLYYGNFDLYFNIGDLEVAPNKEQLQYDDTNNKTATAIINALKIAKNELEAAVKKQVEVPKTLWEAMGLYGKYNAYASTYSNIRNIIGDIPIYFNNSKVQVSNISTHDLNTLVKDGSTLGSLAVYAFVGNGNVRSLKRSSGIYANLDSDIIVYYTDQESIKKTRIRYHLDKTTNVKNDKTGKPIAYVIVDKSPNFKQISFIKKHFGWNTVINVESLPKPPATPRQKKTVVSNEAFVADISNHISWAKNADKQIYGVDVSFLRKSAVVDANETYYYVDFVYSKPSWNGKNIDGILDFVVKEFVKNRLNGTATEIYGINKKNANLMKVGKWINVFDSVKTNVVDANKEKYEDDFYKAELYLKSTSFNSLYSILTNGNGLVSRIKSTSTRNMFFNFIKTYKEIAKKHGEVNKELMAAFGITPKNHISLDCDFSELENTLEKKYMNIFNLSRIYADDSDILSGLVNFIDEKS